MAARRYWPATRAERERPMESLYRLRADIGFCEPRLRGLEKRGGRRPLLFLRKVGGREKRAFERPFAIPPIRSRVQAGSSNSFALAPSLLRSRQTLSFPKSTINSFSFFLEFVHLFFFIAHTLIFSLKIYKYIYVKRVNESSNHFSRIDDQCRQCRESWYRFFLIYDESRRTGGRGEKIWIEFGFPRGYVPSRTAFPLDICRGHTVGNK